MPRKLGLSERDIERRLKKGRGQGELSGYQPFITVQDISSKGRSHRVLGAKTGRIHHLLSDLELAVLLSLEWEDAVTDIREQYPLDRQATIDLAREAGIRHPEVGGVNQVMTSDFLVDTQGRDHRQFAVQVKYTEDLNDPRTVEKLELERRYWRSLDTPWFLVTERDVSKEAVANIKWLGGASTETPDSSDLQRYYRLFRHSIDVAPNQRMVALAQQLDLDYSLEPGEALYWLRILFSQRYFLFDTRTPYQSLLASDLVPNPSLPEGGAYHVAG